MITSSQCKSKTAVLGLDYSFHKVACYLVVLSFCLAALTISLLSLIRGFTLSLLPQQGHGNPSGQSINILHTRQRLWPLTYRRKREEGLRSSSLTHIPLQENIYSLVPGFIDATLIITDVVTAMDRNRGYSSSYALYRKVWKL
jgi:hypothetical protein